MKVDINCPHCGGKVDADYVLKNARVVCPHCSILLVGSPEDASIEVSTGESTSVSASTSTGTAEYIQIDDALLDPTDPAGYFNNFPPEDDF